MKITRFIAPLVAFAWVSLPALAVYKEPDASPQSGGSGAVTVCLLLFACMMGVSFLAPKRRHND